MDAEVTELLPRVVGPPRVDATALVLILLAAAAPVLVAADVTPLLRIPVVLLLVCVVPGLAVVRLSDPPDPLTTVVLAVALTFALDIVVAMPLLYLRQWSPSRELVALAAVTVIITVVRLVRRRRTS